MLNILLGPLLFLMGAALLMLAIHGRPSTPQFARPQGPAPDGRHLASLALPRLSRGNVKRPAQRPGRGSPVKNGASNTGAGAQDFPDLLLTDLLNELIQMREDMANIKAEIAALKAGLAQATTPQSERSTPKTGRKRGKAAASASSAA